MPPVWLRALDVHAGTVQSLAVPVVPPALVGIDVTFAGQVHTLELAPFDVRSPSFQLLERGAFGLQPVTAPAATTFRGAVVGEAGSAVAASIDGGTLRAYVRRGNGELWIVQPLSDVLAGAPAAAHAVFRGADSAPANGRCGVTDGARPVTPMMGGIDVTYLCDLALEADHPLFVINGSNLAATQNDVLGVVNAIDLIYRTDVQVTLQVSQLIVDSVPDAYTSNVAGTLLTQFRGHWNANYGGITRDVAHLFSGRPLGANSGGTIGIAYVGVVCDLPNAYGVSQTRWSANFAYRVGLTAHELGHNFNASHCDGQPTCSIMCSVVGGCTNNPGAFSVNEQAQIIAYRQNANCLVLQATMPQITSATPSQMATVNPPLVTLTGSGFLGTTLATVGGQPVTSTITVVSDTTLRFVPPAGLPLGIHPVSVTNPAGTSNATLVWYTGANPCQVLVPPAIYGGATMPWKMGGWANDYGYLGLSWVNTTTPFLGLPLLDGFLVLWQGPLDARGMATFSVTVPPGLLTGFTFYSQLLDVIPAGPSLRSVSTTPGTWIVF